MRKNFCKGKIILAVLIALVSFCIASCSSEKEKEPEATLPADTSYREGFYLPCSGGAHMIVMNGYEPCVMTPDNDAIAFDGLTAGDRIRIEVWTIQETYPMKATVYAVEKLGDGALWDIDADTLNALAEMGWIERFKDFDPEAFGAYIPNESAEVLFHYRIFCNQVYLYFCSIRQLTPQGTEFADEMPQDFAVYYTDDGFSVRKLDVGLPDDLVYDSVCPIYAGAGAGSGECEFILQLTNGGETYYVSFNNFAYTDADNFLDFEYAGVMPNETVNEHRKWRPDLFH